MTAPGSTSAAFGPLAVNVTGPSVPGPLPGPGDYGVRKMVAPFAIVVGTRTVGTGTFTYGSTRDPGWLHAGDIVRSVLDDLGSVHPYADEPDTLTAWTQWADDAGTFVQGRAADVRASLDAWQTIAGWRAGILDALGADGEPEAGTVLDVLLLVARMLDDADECVTPAGELLTFAGTAAYVEQDPDPWRGQRWEADGAGAAMSAGEILAAHFEAAGCSA